MTRTLLLAALLCLPCMAQDRLWQVSLVAVAGASAADWASSLGHYEANPLLRGRDGRFAAGRAASLKVGLFAASAYGQAKTPRRRKLQTIINFALAGVYAGVAVRNARVR